MKLYRFILEKYHGASTRHLCPGCGDKRSFTRYIDTETGQHLDPLVGKCNRDVNCGYHLTPKQYFHNNPEIITQQITIHKSLKVPQTNAVIPHEIMIKTLDGYDRNNFIDYLKNLFDMPTTLNLAHKYNIGTSKYWPGATIFWFIDKHNQIKAGQVKLFDSTGHTVKNHTTWVHSIIDRKSKNNSWLEAYLKNDCKVTCLFGEHLLKSETMKPVAIVEAPATAITASVYLPWFIWLAAGSLSYLTPDRCKSLKGRNVVLFPDLGGYDKWYGKIELLNTIANFKVSDLLERKATEKEKSKGLDLRDYLMQSPLNEYISENHQQIYNNYESQ